MRVKVCAEPDAGIVTSLLRGTGASRLQEEIARTLKPSSELWSGQATCTRDGRRRQDLETGRPRPAGTRRRKEQIFLDHRYNTLKLAGSDGAGLSGDK